jgi:hypothetical protein
MELESEIVDGIPEYSVASLHADGRETVLIKKDEVLNDNFSEKETKLNSNQIFVDSGGQVVPAHSLSCLKPETETSQNREQSTIPQGREESGQISSTDLHQHELLEGPVEGKGFEQLASTLSTTCESLTKDKITEQHALIHNQGNHLIEHSTDSSNF